MFKSGNGDGLQADCRLEVVAWPDRTVHEPCHYCPISFTELRDYRGWTLFQRAGDTWSAIDQSAFGNDFWQVNKTAAGRFTITFNVLLDAGAGLQHFRLLSGEIMDGSGKQKSEWIDDKYEDYPTTFDLVYPQCPQRNRERNGDHRVNMGIGCRVGRLCCG